MSQHQAVISKEFPQRVAVSLPILAQTLGEEAAKVELDKCKEEILHGLHKEYLSGSIDETQFKEQCLQFKRFFLQGKVGAEDAQSVRESSQTKSTPHWVGGLEIPYNINTLPILAFSPNEFVSPNMVDLRDYCLPPLDQGDNPWCAAIAACGFAANVLWRKTDKPVAFDPAMHYAYAKKTDGNPESQGTTLIAALESLLHHNLFSSAVCKVKVLRQIESVRYAIHKFGCCLVGLMVTEEWYECKNGKSTIDGGSHSAVLGGHAVLACGFTRDGLIIQNSWGAGWGSYGFALITWEELKCEFLYGAVVDNCLYDIKMN